MWNVRDNVSENTMKCKRSAVHFYFINISSMMMRPNDYQKRPTDIFSFKSRFQTYNATELKFKVCLNDDQFRRAVLEKFGLQHHLSTMTFNRIPTIYARFQQQV